MLYISGEKMVKSMLSAEILSHKIRKMSHTKHEKTSSKKKHQYKGVNCMKATGIVRRIDDLGRVVVPKEIRKTLHIREGDPLEIFTDREGEIILKKYSPIGELGAFAKQYAEALAQNTGHIVSITDRDNHIAAAGTGKRELLNKPVSSSLETLIEGRKILAAAAGDKAYVPLRDNETERYSYEVICPIISEGDAIGSVVIASKDDKTSMGEVEKKLAAAAAGFLGRQIEQ